MGQKPGVGDRGAKLSRFKAGDKQPFYPGQKLTEKYRSKKLSFSSGVAFNIAAEEGEERAREEGRIEAVPWPGKVPGLLILWIGNCGLEEAGVLK